MLKDFNNRQPPSPPFPITIPRQITEQIAAKLPNKLTPNYRTKSCQITEKYVLSFVGLGIFINFAPENKVNIWLHIVKDL